MHLKIPKISHDEAISAFIKGLHFHEALRSKLLRKRPTTVAELLATAKNYADAEDASGKMFEEPSTSPDETTAVDASTTGTLIVATTATTEKDGIGVVITVITSEANDLATTVKRSNG